MCRAVVLWGVPVSRSFGRHVTTAPKRGYTCQMEDWKLMQLSRNQTDPMLLKWKRNHSGCVLLVKGNNFPRRPLLVLWCQRRSSPFLAETRPFQRWQLNACKLATSTSILQSKQSQQLTLTHTHTHTRIQTHDGRCNSAQTPLLVNVSFISSKNSIVPSKNKNENGKDLQ